jgi:hypothetical protein
MVEGQKITVPLICERIIAFAVPQDVFAIFDGKGKNLYAPPFLPAIVER